MEQWFVSLAKSLIRTGRRLVHSGSRWRKHRKCVVLPGAVLHPQSRIENNRQREDIVVGEQSQVLGELLTFGHGGQIRVGKKCFIGEDTRIWSASSIAIGDRTLISYGVSIHDCNSHSLSAAHRAAHFEAIFSTGHPRELPDVDAAPIVIGSDTWIGFGATILKGVTIGDGAVIGACSVVREDVAPFTVVAGNPARFIKNSR